jgi:ATP-dependent DNA helicase RecG
MFDTVEQLLEQIRLGEDSSLELKAVVFAGEKLRGPSRDDLADELAAFANAHGGVLVLGVDDKTREITGIPVGRLDAAESYAREVVHDSVKPPLMPRIERLLLPGEDGQPRAVIKIDVPRSLWVHRSPGGYFYRVGSSKREMETDYLARLLQQRSQARLIRFDEQIVADATLEDLDAASVERFRTERSADPAPQLLRKLGMAREDEGGTLRPSVSGVLFASAHPERWLPNAFIQAVSYRGEGIPGEADVPGYQLDAKDIVGPLPMQVEEACRFVTKNMRTVASKSVGRHDVSQFDAAAVFEAVVNAVAHRDYSMHGAKIRLRMFANRLELYVPGALANTLTLDSLEERQSSRNETIASLLAKCPVPASISGLETGRSTMMDRRGEGVSIILSRSEKLSGRRPLYELPDQSELKLTIYGAEA